MTRLHDYITANSEVITQVFQSLDTDGSGKLDIYETCRLVGMIPGLDVAEVRYILIYMIDLKDTNADSKFSFEELVAIVSS